eukprot:5486252-Amphidinium_carterae.1
MRVAPTAQGTPTQMPRRASSAPPELMTESYLKIAPKRHRSNKHVWKAGGGKPCQNKRLHLFPKMI